MDAVASSVAFVHSVRNLGFKNKQIVIVTAKSGLVSILFEVGIYFGLILLGVMSLNKLTLSENGGIALSEIFHYYLGNLGAIFLGITVTLGVFTTAMRLVASFAQDFHKLFPKVSYVFWLRLTTCISFVIANAGLDNIIQWSLSVLMLL
ncbi:branched-chain amino acid transport system II carrier protein [Enterococcus faecalis]|uniref:branched-chain amino acid transport system II carrier protein n=1 Tax=Enterococcus faecalis TaxID=1351 RepID=UPI0034E5C3B1